MENVDKIVLKKVNGEMTIKEMTPALQEKINNDKGHLCGDKCAIKIFFGCPKVKDEHKKTIDKYDFITDGIQVIKNNEIDEFIVQKCTRFEEAPKKAKLTAEEKAHIRNQKRSMKTAYFDTSSIEKANIEQYMNEQRGKIKGISGNRPSEESMIKLINDQPNAEDLLRELSGIKKTKQEKIEEEKVQAERLLDKAIKELVSENSDKAYKRVKEKEADVLSKVRKLNHSSKLVKLIDNNLETKIKEREAKEEAHRIEIEKFKLVAQLKNEQETSSKHKVKIAK